MRRFYYLLLLGVVIAAIAILARSGLFTATPPAGGAARSSGGSEASPELSAEDAAFIQHKYPTASRTSSGLMFVVRTPGTGVAVPQTGQEVIAHYDGRLLDGTPFDSSYKRGVPFTFRVGTGAVIKGWDEAFLSMKKGEKRTLIVPHWLGYGVDGRGPIPAKATLVFEVELIDFR